MCGHCRERYWWLSLLPWGPYNVRRCLYCKGCLYITQNKAKTQSIYLHIQDYILYFRRGCWNSFRPLRPAMYFFVSSLPLHLSGPSQDPSVLTLCLGWSVPLFPCHVYQHWFLWVSFKLSIEPTDGSFTCVQTYVSLVRHGDHIGVIFQDSSI